MKVLLVTDWPLRFAGTERYVMSLYGELRSAGHEVRLMTSSIGSRAEGKAAYVARTTDRPRAQAFLQIANPSALTTMRRALREFDPDVVHLAMFLPYLSPAVLMPLRDRPTTTMVIDFKAVCPVGTKLLPDGRQCRVRMGTVCHREGCLSAPRAARDAVRYGGFRALLGNVDRVLACSRHIAGELALAGIEARHEPLPIADPEPAFPRHPAAAPRFVYAGRLAPIKGLGLLLRAFAGLRETFAGATLQICGDGRGRDEVFAEVERLGVGDSVEFMLGMPEDWTRSLSDAWALVAPSIYREPLGLVAIEAIVRGVPVIASREGGFGESVEDGRSGMLFPNGDGDALLACMRAISEGREFPELAPDPDARARLARRHDLGDHVRRMETTWKEIGA